MSKSIFFPTVYFSSSVLLEFMIIFFESIMKIEKISGFFFKATILDASKSSSSNFIEVCVSRINSGKLPILFINSLVIILVTKNF